MTLLARHGPEWTFIDHHQFLLIEPDQLNFMPEEDEKLSNTRPR
ncbi:hypothetical protein [Actinomadura decatromicini]|nr:hypothetical protein [Actinomadura decatromicini]